MKNLGEDHSINFGNFNDIENFKQKLLDLDEIENDIKNDIIKLNSEEGERIFEKFVIRSNKEKLRKLKEELIQENIKFEQFEEEINKNDHNLKDKLDELESKVNRLLLKDI